MRSLKRLGESWRVLWQILLTGKGQVVLTCILLGVFLIFLIESSRRAMGFPGMWQSWMEAFLAGATILIATFIWFNEKRQEWQNSLPKKLDACFDYDGEEIYIVENASLAGSDDVRQWGQQLGWQMNGGKNLLFKGFKVEEPQREFNKETGKHVMKYRLTVWLQKLDAGTKRKKWSYDDEGKFEKEVLLGGHSSLPPSKSAEPNYLCPCALSPFLVSGQDAVSSPPSCNVTTPQAVAKT